MKKTSVIRDRSKSGKLSLRSEAIRTLTARELTLVVAGNCLNASMYSQGMTMNLAGTC
jgi:hypothetical protein